MNEVWKICHFKNFDEITSGSAEVRYLYQLNSTSRINTFTVKGEFDEKFLNPKPKGVITQMKALDECFLVVVFPLLLNGVHVCGNFMFNLNRGTWTVKGRLRACLFGPSGDEKNPYFKGWLSNTTVCITQRPCHSEAVLQLIQDVVDPQWILLVGMIRKNPSFQGRYDGRHVWHHSYSFSGIGPNKGALNLDAEVWRLNNLNSAGEFNSTTSIAWCGEPALIRAFGMKKFYNFKRPCFVTHQRAAFLEISFQMRGSDAQFPPKKYFWGEYRPTLRILFRLNSAQTSNEKSEFDTRQHWCGFSSRQIQELHTTRLSIERAGNW